MKAEESYSEDMLLNTAWELRDVYPEMIDLLYVFDKCPTRMSREKVVSMIDEVGLKTGSSADAIELLVWFGFLGVQERDDEPEFSYQVRYNLAKLMAPLERGRADLVVHPAFRRALSCREVR